MVGLVRLLPHFPKVDFLTPGRVGDGIENGHGYSFSLLDKLVENLVPFFLG